MRTHTIASVIRSFAVLAVMATAGLPMIGNDAAGDAARDGGTSAASASTQAPVVVAQGRCFNGRCY